MEYSRVEGPTKIVQNRLNTWKTWIVYLLPVTCTAVLLYINFAHIYWFPISGISVGPDRGLKITANNILNSLQLAAKLYEILVVASLGAMALETFRLHLIGDGIPFALLTGAYRVFDVLYLFNPRFWMAAPRAICLAVLLLLSIILCTLIGPASAILMVPKLGWFPLPNAFSNISMPLFTALPSTAVWPTVLNGTLWEVGRMSLCKQAQGSFAYWCPAAGLSSIYSWTAAWMYSGLRNNLTFEDPSGSISRRLDVWENDTNGTFVSGPTSLTAAMLGQFDYYFKSQDIGDISHTKRYRLRLSPVSVTYQPLVNVKCDVWDLGQYSNISQVPVMRYPYRELGCFSAHTEDECFRIREVISDVQLSEGLLANFTWGTLFAVIYGRENAANENMSSLVFQARLPYPYKGEIGLRMAACSYMAHWIPSQVLVDTGDGPQLQSNITDLSIFSDEKKWKETRRGATAIRIQRSWLPYLDLGSLDVPSANNNSQNAPRINRTGGLENVADLIGPLIGVALLNDGSYLEYFLPGTTNDTGSPEDSAYEIQVVLEKLTGVIVTDAIARTAAFSPSYALAHEADDGSIIATNLMDNTGTGASRLQFFSNGSYISDTGQMNQTGKTPREWMETFKRDRFTMYLEAERFGYGYGNPGGSMAFAFVVIFTYLIILFVYWLVTLYRRTTSVAALGDLQDVVALAWRSSAPSHLGNHGVGFEDKSLWQENVVLRATSSRSVALVLDKDGEEMRLTRLRKGEQYF